MSVITVCNAGASLVGYEGLSEVSLPEYNAM